MENTSGITPVEYKALVLPDEVVETTEGGIFIPDETKEREQWAKIKATLIALGGGCFEDIPEPLPKPGDKVLISKYAGTLVDGNDNQTYRIIADKDIAAIIKE